MLWSLFPSSISTKNYFVNIFRAILSIGLHHPLDGVTNPKYKLLRFIHLTFFCKKKWALAFNWDRCCHLALFLWLILFHWLNCQFLSSANSINWTTRRWSLAPSSQTVRSSFRTPSWQSQLGKLSEAVFSVMRSPSMNKLCVT